MVRERYQWIGPCGLLVGALETGSRKVEISISSIGTSNRFVPHLILQACLSLNQANGVSRLILYTLFANTEALPTSR